MKGRSYRMMLLALATVFMVAGCGGDNSDKVSNPDAAVAFAIHEQPDGIPGKLLNDVKAKSEGAGWQFVNEIAGGNANLQLDQVNKMMDDKAAAIKGLLQQIKQGQFPGKGDVRIPMIAITKDNLSQYK